MQLVLVKKTRKWECPISSEENHHGSYCNTVTYMKPSGFFFLILNAHSFYTTSINEAKLNLHESLNTLMGLIMLLMV